jgi:hypothetical protein
MRSLVIALVLLGACSSVETTRPQLGHLADGITCVITLKHAPPQEIVDILTDLMEASRNATATRDRGYCALMTPEYWASAPARDRQEKRRFVADASTGSIVINLSLEEVDDLENIVELIRRLDVDDPRPR